MRGKGQQSKTKELTIPGGGPPGCRGGGGGGGGPTIGTPGGGGPGGGGPPGRGGPVIRFKSLLKFSKTRNLLLEQNS